MKIRRVLLCLGIGFTAISLGLMIIYIAALFVPIETLTGDRIMLGMLLQVLALQLVGMGGTTAAYIYLSDRDIAFLRLKKPNLVDVALMLVGPYALILANGLMLTLVNFLGHEPSPHELVGIFNENPEIALYMIPVAILVIGPFEELLFRGVIQSELVDGYGSVPGVLIASVIFAVVHLPAYSGSDGVESAAVSLSALFVLSLILGSVYEWRDNLYVVMVMHGLYNALLFAVIWMTHEFDIDPEEFAAMVMAFC